MPHVCGLAPSREGAQALALLSFQRRDLAWDAREWPLGSLGRGMPARFSHFAGARGKLESGSPTDVHVR